jgi:DNA polymerase III sliding clamp (beta) subunit (PCNA family)
MTDAVIIANRAYKSKELIFDLTPGEIVISTIGNSNGEAVERVAAEYEGEPERIGCQMRLLAEFLPLAEGKVSLAIKDAISPFEMRVDGDDSYRYIVMPMNLRAAENSSIREAAKKAA